MKINHSSSIRLPNLREITDIFTKKVMDQFVRVVHDALKKIYDDIVQLSEKKRHTISSASSLTLGIGGVYVYSGAVPTTWTLPELSREFEKCYFIKNRGSDTITLTRAGTDEIWDTSAVNTLAIVAGASYMITNDGTYWIVFDLN